MDVSGFSALTPAEQREYLRILEKMTTKQAVVTPGKTQGGRQASEGWVPHDDRADFSALKDSFDKLDAGEFPSRTSSLTSSARVTCCNQSQLLIGFDCF